jgi:RNA polymerase sigma-70 factor, ECF subfamily
MKIRFSEKCHFDNEKIAILSKNKKQTEQTLFSRAKSGDSSAFREIFDNYQKRVYSVAFGILGNNYWAEEATQEVFVRIFRSISNYDVRRKFFTYLYRITVNVCFDLLKREKSRAVEFVDPEEKQLAEKAEKFDSNPLKKIEHKEFFKKIQQLIQRLGLNQRTAFILRDLEGRNTKEIAKILKCRKSTVRAHLHFARKSIKEKIEAEYPEFLED